MEMIYRFESITKTYMELKSEENQKTTHDGMDETRQQQDWTRMAVTMIVLCLWHRKNSMWQRQRCTDTVEQSYSERCTTITHSLLLLILIII